MEKNKTAMYCYLVMLFGDIDHLRATTFLFVVFNVQQGHGK